MKEIIVAEHSGFCFGVKKAIDITEKEIERMNSHDVSKNASNKNHIPNIIPQNTSDNSHSPKHLTARENYKLYTCGPLIHNTTVTDELSRKGALILDDLNDTNPGDVLIIRSHGEGKAFFDAAAEKKCRIVDATCIFVKKIQDLVSKGKEEDYHILIIGDKNHPEVLGINGWCNNTATIVNSAEEAHQVTADNLFVVSQTTITQKLFDDVISEFKKNNKQMIVNNTICNATTKRQNATEELAKTVDAMVIVGGQNSSNTRKLYEIAKNNCKHTFFVEKNDDLPLQELKKYNTIGVAAGASTPANAIKEVIANMSENTMENKSTMEDYMKEIDASFKLFRVGEIVTGKVHHVTDKEIVINMGSKKDGIIPKEEVLLEEGEKLSDLFNEGDEVQAKVLKTDDGDGSVLLSKKNLQIGEHWKEIIEAHDNKEIINVKVVRTVNGGVLASYKEVTGFIPLSQLSDNYIENAQEFIGQEFDVKVSRVDVERGRAIFSRKLVLSEQRKEKLDKIWETVHEDDIIEGKVMRFTDYGAFIDIGGIDGLLHISEISWGKLKHPKEVLKIGETVSVKVLSMDIEKGKISLGLKQTTPEPWMKVQDTYAVDQVITGKILQIKEYGAFVELEPGVDGLVHISEIAHRRVTNVADECTLGQVVEAKILDINSERKRISLSIKAILEKDENDYEDSQETAATPASEEPAAAESVESQDAPDADVEATEE